MKSIRREPIRSSTPLRAMIAARDGEQRKPRRTAPSGQPPTAGRVIDADAIAPASIGRTPPSEYA